MQIKSCLKTQGLLNVIHYTVYLFISNIGTGSPGGRQRQAERPKSRRVNYRQNELFQPPPLPPPARARLPHPGRPRPPSRPPAASPRAACCSAFSRLASESLSSLCLSRSSSDQCLCFLMSFSVLGSASVLSCLNLLHSFCLSLLAFSGVIPISSRSGDGLLGV